MANVRLFKDFLTPQRLKEANAGRLREVGRYWALVGVEDTVFEKEPRRIDCDVVHHLLFAILHALWDWSIGLEFLILEIDHHGKSDLINIPARQCKSFLSWLSLLLRFNHACVSASPAAYKHCSIWIQDGSLWGVLLQAQISNSSVLRRRQDEDVKMSGDLSEGPKERPEWRPVCSSLPSWLCYSFAQMNLSSFLTKTNSIIGHAGRDQ